MYTYTTGRNYYGQLTQNTSTANLTLGDSLINQYIKMVINRNAWPFREGTITRTTVADQQGYGLQPNVGKVTDVYLMISTTKYIPTEITSIEEWNYLTAPNTYSSDTPQFYFVDYENREVLLHPTPATEGNTLYIKFKKSVKDLSIADYTTGTIVSIANGATTVTGSGTSWTNKMVGRFIRITDSDTANTGDGFWYEIDSVTSGTVLELKTPYAGTAIAAGSATYAIGQASIIPEDFQHLPIIKAAEVYFSTIQPNTAKATRYKEMFNEDFDIMMNAHGSKSDSPVLTKKRKEITNPNLYVTAS